MCARKKPTNIQSAQSSAPNESKINGKKLKIKADENWKKKELKEKKLTQHRISK